MSDDIERRLRRLEMLLANLDDDGLAQVPAEWARLDYDNAPLGPPPTATAAELRTWAMASQMLASIPHRPPD
jgi:hypothetical protein